jgi:hypothetical protein
MSEPNKSQNESFNYGDKAGGDEFDQRFPSQQPFDNSSPGNDRVQLKGLPSIGAFSSAYK